MFVSPQGNPWSFHCHMVKPLSNQRLVQADSMPEERPDEETYRAQATAVMCFSMSMCLSIWHKGGTPRLSEHETKKTSSVY